MGMYSMFATIVAGLPMLKLQPTQAIALELVVRLS